MGIALDIREAGFRGGVVLVAALLVTLAQPLHRAATLRITIMDIAPDIREAGFHGVVIPVVGVVAGVILAQPHAAVSEALDICLAVDIVVDIVEAPDGAHHHFAAPQLAADC